MPDADTRAVASCPLHFHATSLHWQLTVLCTELAKDEHGLFHGVFSCRHPDCTSNARFVLQEKNVKGKRAQQKENEPAGQDLAGQPAAGDEQKEKSPFLQISATMGWDTFAIVQKLWLSTIDLPTNSPDKDWEMQVFPTMTQSSCGLCDSSCSSEASAKTLHHHSDLPSSLLTNLAPNTSKCIIGCFEVCSESLANLKKLEACRNLHKSNRLSSAGHAAEFWSCRKWLHHYPQGWKHDFVAWIARLVVKLQYANIGEINIARLSALLLQHLTSCYASHRSCTSARAR